MNGRRVTLIGASLLLHIAALMGTGMIPVPTIVEEVMVTMRVHTPDPEPPLPEPVELEPVDAPDEPELPADVPAEPEPAPTPEPAPAERPDPPRQEAATPASAEPGPSSAAPADGMPEFGVVLTGGAGPGGVAVATGRPDGVRNGTGTLGIAGGTPQPPPVERTVLEDEPGRMRRRDRCTGETRDARRARGIRRATFPDAALRAGISGRVRVRVAIDEAGNPSAMTALDNLGYGLEEAALRALQDIHFEPAIRCGQPVPSDTIISIRFEHE